jgi:hypothetical protein
MQTAPNLFGEEPAGQIQEVHYTFQESRSGEALSSLDWLDAFILSHAELGFNEFFRRLQRLDAWQDLLAQEALQVPRGQLR